MAFNKQKAVEAAQKHLNQGRVTQAIAEYQQILRHEPRDQVTLMTIGDLYVRQGETFQALEYFERLAQLFLSDGFVTKAIAIYKKIAKLAPEESKPLEKLAELYVQQGIMSEARPLYLQLAEVHLKANRHQQAVVLLRKLLEVEPENLRVQNRLADLYHAMGQDKEAAEAFVTSAQAVMARGDNAEAERLTDRALKIDPNHAGALAIKARAMAASGKRSDAATLLEGIPELDSGSEATSLLVDQYLQGSKADKAIALARKVFSRDPKNFDLCFRVGTALVEAGKAEQALEILEPIREAMIEAGDSERLAQTLTGAAEKIPGCVEPLEWLVDLYGKTNDSFRLPEALGQLGEAAAASGQLERAKQVYEQLLERDPEDDAARRRLNQVRVRMGLEPIETQPVATGVVLMPPSEPAIQSKPAPPPVEPPLGEEIQTFVSQSLTDVDLFSSYGLTQKAVDLLETILQRAPRHAPALEKLLDLYLGAGNDRRTAEIAGELEQIYLQRGDASNAERFSELRRRFQRAAGMAPEEAVAKPQPAPEEFPLPTVAAEPVVEVEAVPAGEPAVHEVDLSEEWAALTQHPAEPEPPPPVAPAPPPAYVAEAFPPPPPPAAPSVELHAEASPAPPASQEHEIVAELPAEVGVPVVDGPEYELTLEAEPAEAEVPATLHTNVEAPAHLAPQALSSDQFLSDLASELDSLGASPGMREVPMPPARDTVHASSPSARASAPAVSAPPPAPPPPKASPGAPLSEGPLREVFDEFRAELGEMGVEDEDLETHYNLGIAYREMGLLDEAIGEFQKVAKATDKGRPFRYTMQCCTLLGLAFMEKGQPQIAAMWYERALQTAGLDQESILALRYDLGVAQELAGDEEAAMKSFSQVYAMNIDYRDVADRISALSKRR